MNALRYTTEHEWLRLDDDGLVTVGITAYAQHALGDVVYVQLPEPGTYARGAEAAVLESVKAASNILMPVDGEVVETNSALDANPGLLNADPLGAGWCFRIRATDPGQLDGLMDEDAYGRLVTALADE